MNPTENMETEARTDLDGNQYQCRHCHNWASKSSLDAAGKTI